MDDRFLSLVAAVLGISEKELQYDSTTETVPQWTSLSHWEIIGVIENEYDIEFTMDEATEFKNLGELYELMQKKRV
jgi:acyl carrier protein